MTLHSRQTIGVIFGNRNFFPDHLVGKARAEVSALFRRLELDAVMLSESDTKLGGVESLADARKCAELFQARRQAIKGVLLVLANFGDEKAVADALRLSGLACPVLVQAYPDELAELGPATRRDGFCGKISVCNNLFQYGIPFSLTEQHVVAVGAESFREDLLRFLALCRVVSGMRRVRIGAVGARPNAFNTVRYSEKILERHGVSVCTVDLSEILAAMSRLQPGDARVAAESERLSAYAAAKEVPGERLAAMASLGVALRDWIERNEVDAIALQCWTSLQENVGVNPCAVMSMLSEQMLPSACEVDVTGALTMYALQLASGTPAGLADWNNNYAAEPDKCVLFHCGNWPKSLLGGKAAIRTAPILGTSVGEANTVGALEGRAPAGPLTFGRLTTDDAAGTLRAYVGEGSFTDDKLDTFGSRAVVEVPGLQSLLRFICRNGFEHHVAMTRSRTASVLAEAFRNYLKWDTYRHEG